MNSEDIACLLAIIIGGIVTIIHPNYMGDAFNNTIIAIILIKLFW
jgi:hypothetical protein